MYEDEARTSFENAVTKRINELKQQHGDSTRDIAEATGISKSSLNRKLNQVNSWTLLEMDSLAKYWGFKNGFELLMGAKKYDEEAKDSRLETCDRVKLNYASREQAKKLTKKYDRNEEGEIILPYGLAAYEGNPRDKEFLWEQDEPA